MSGRLHAPVIAPQSELIDVRTKISIRCASDQVVIFYTINGQSPDPFQTIGDKFTIKYTKPFTLPLGKRAVKAVALSKVHKTADASPMVTKYFHVIEQLPEHEEEDHDRVGDVHRDGAEVTRRIAPALAPDVAREITEALMRGSLRETEVFHQWKESAQEEEPEHARASARCSVCNARWPQDPTAQFCSVCGYQLQRAATTAATTVTGAARRPPSPHSPTLPCPFCASPLRPDARFCVTCQNRLPDLHTSRSRDAAIKTTICSGCGARNAASLQHCTYCDTQLTKPEAAAHAQGPSAVSAPGSAGCRNCSKPNAPGTRFCGWCGYKIPPAPQTFACVSCHAENRLGSRFCNECGAVLFAPAPDHIPPQSHLPPSSRPTHSSTARAADTGTPYFRQTTVRMQPVLVDANTQTIFSLDTVAGPTANGDERKIKKKANGSVSVEDSDARGLPFQPGTVSAGRGYWRQQIDHVAGGLKHFAKENAAFQAALGQPHVADVLRARIEQDDNEVLLTIVLKRVPSPPESKDKTLRTRPSSAPRPATLDPSDRASFRDGTRMLAEESLGKVSALLKAQARSEEEGWHRSTVGMRSERSHVRTLEKDLHSLSARVTESLGSSHHGEASGHTDRRATSRGPHASTSSVIAGTSRDATHASSGTSHSSTLGATSTSGGGGGGSRGVNPHTKVLLQELGDHGEGREDVVLGALDSGADANATLPGKQRPIHLAASRGLHKCIPLLADAGADLNAKDRKGATALHAAVAASKHDQECVEALLNAGADVTQRDNDGLTPAALAVANGKRALATLFGAHVGRSVVTRFANQGMA